MTDKRILLIEDNQDDVELTRRAFKRADIAATVDVAADGQEALDYLFGDGRPAGPLPTLVLLDLKLPRVDGHEVLRRMRADERTRLLPVVILTTSTQESDVVNGYREGANSYVRKPVDFTEFADAVQQLGRYWLALNHPPPLGAHG